MRCLWESGPNQSFCWLKSDLDGVVNDDEQMNTSSEQRDPSHLISAPVLHRSSVTHCTADYELIISCINMDKTVFSFNSEDCKKGPGWNDPMTAVVPRVKGFACYDLSFSRHNKNIKMEHFFLYILSRYFIWLHKMKRVLMMSVHH